MSNPNGTVAEPEILIPQDALDAVDLSIPDDYADEIAAGQIVENLTGYHRAVREQKAARQNEDHQRAEALGKLVVFHRNSVALAQHERPRAKAIADAIMGAQARNAAASRAKSNAGK